MLAEVSQPPGLWGYIIAVLVPVAILVYWYGNFRLQRQIRRGLSSERGRRSPGRGAPQDPNFTAMVGRMVQRGLLTPVAEASTGPVMVRGTLTTADATLGGAPGRECVWQNRSGAPRDAAVAVDYVIIADATGRATIENLALAEVVAPEAKLGPHRSFCSLLLGDEVEVIARFTPERYGEEIDPTRLVYGTLGANGQLYVRVHRRDKAPEPAGPVEPAPGTHEALATPPQTSSGTTQ